MNIFFMGGKKIGCECLRKLVDYVTKNNEVNIVGVLPSSRGSDVMELATSNGLPVFSTLEEFLAVKNIDINISIQYHGILRQKHLDNARLNINLHMAPLPEYRGCNQFSMAILDQKTYFGTTIHLMDTGIDSGDILFESRFDIDPEIWVEELYEKTFQASVDLFERSIGKIIKGDYERVSQDSLISERGMSTHYRREIEELKKIDLSWKKEKISRHVRATLMPGFPPPYIETGGKTVYFSKAE